MNTTSRGLDAAMSDIQNGEYLRKLAARGATDEKIEEAREYLAQPGALAELAPAEYSLKGEQPIYILMCYLMASGKTTEEIAAQTGYTPAGVRLIQKQPSFRKRFLEITKEGGQEAVEAFVKGQSMASLEVLVEVRDDKGTLASTRVQAANAILDRALGKPAVYVKTESSLNLNSAASTKEDLERQLAAVREEAKTRGINTATSRN